jgi:hypothetical protein
VVVCYLVPLNGSIMRRNYLIKCKKYLKYRLWCKKSGFVAESVKHSQLGKLIILITGKMIYKGKNYSIKLREYFLHHSLFSLYIFPGIPDFTRIHDMIEIITSRRKYVLEIDCVNKRIYVN